MLKKFEVENYKNFKEKLTINFDEVGGYQFSTECINQQLIGKMLIYGRNATGKTNLGKALLDIGTIFSNYRFIGESNEVFLNADSKKKYAKFKYVFQFKDKEVIYQYKKKTEMQLYDEELFLDGKPCFYCNFDTKELNFQDLKILEADTIITERYLEAMGETTEDEEKQTLSFLRWLIGNTALQEDSILLKLRDYIKGMNMVASGARQQLPPRFYEKFFERLEEENKLKELENFLNLMGIKCELVLKKLPDGVKKLYFKHNHLVSFFENASSGTKALFELYRMFESKKESSMIYFDEFDAFYHYEMSEKVIEFFKENYPNCQMIMTTHNTNLMRNRLLRPDCLFILSRSGKLTALCNATRRELREGHNLEKMYVSGEFELYE